jgi:Tfp pilus assembly protein PilF
LVRAKNTLRTHDLRERYIEAQRARYTERARVEAGEAAGDLGIGLPAAPSAELELDQNADRDRETRQLAERAYVEAKRLLVANDLEMARQKLAVAIRLNGHEPGYHVALACTLLAADENDPANRRQAAGLLQHALKLDPSHVDANYELGRLLVLAGQTNAARIYIMRVLQRAPEHREARALMAKIVL